MAPETEPRGPEAPEGPVLAAGCVLWRGTAAGGVEVALVHRPRYDDWSHPKGKLHPGEPPQSAAVREVREETGMVCVLGQPLRTVRYLAMGRPKEVRYWAAEAVGGGFVPNEEVDRVVWLAPAEARVQLTSPQDREVLDEALGSLNPL
ncbi:NUDIX hydrolase [Streptomyces hoynatensis]|uniref:NUDIX hydrolase n=1 Tax=Streptomyces hoynatensis TaxID=1141874 RepID=A0A3A9Z2Z4_9ACTN|nr:NUDIX hydrolase [Streptomyces hoynatensis]RKN41786.1 NUDIX hydrolase [Streptomyces hoynatensis]